MSLTDVTDWSAQCDLIYLYIYSVKETVQYVTWLNKIRGMYSQHYGTYYAGKVSLNSLELKETFHNNVLTVSDVLVNCLSLMC